MNYYELLEVTPNASTEVIKNSYKTLAKKFHPDTYSGSRTFAEEKMKLLNEAISVLGNEEKRRNYNKENSIGIYSSITTVFSSSDSDDSTDAFIEEIDNFLNKKSKKTGKIGKENPLKQNKSDIYDIKSKEDDIRDNENENEDEDEDEDGYVENIDILSTMQMKYPQKEISSEDEEDDEDIVKAAQKYRRHSKLKSKPQVGKWYYITIGAIVALNILLIFLITRMLNLGNIKNFLSAKGGESSVAGNIGDENEFNTEYNLENMGEDIDDTLMDEIATEPTMESDYALAVSDGMPIPRSAEEDETEQNVTLPPQTQPKTQAPTTKAVVKTPIPAATQKPTAALKATVPATEATTENPIDNVSEETTVSIVEQDTTEPIIESETQELVTDPQEADEKTDDIPETTAGEIETTEAEAVLPPTPQEENTVPPTEPAAPAENQNAENIEKEVDIDIVEH